MIQIQTELNVADNTGAKKIECIKVLGGAKRRYASIGDIIVVEVTRKFKHPFYEKVIKRTKKYHAHDEKNKFKEGEIIEIIECNPISKKKKWRVLEK